MEKNFIVIDKQTASHYNWGDNCDSWVMVDSTGLSIKQESMPGSTREKLHFHSHAQQFFYVLKGTATFYPAGERIWIGEQKGLLIKPGIRHYIANETDETLEFLVISQPSTNQDRTTLE